MKGTSLSLRRPGTLRKLAFVTACGVALASGAWAEEGKGEGGSGVNEETGVKIGGFTINTNLAMLTDWVSEGFTQTNGQPAVQGEFVVSRNGFHANAWISNMKSFDPDTGITLTSEIDLTFGYEKEIKDFTFSIEGVYVTYPDSDNPYYNYDYWEYKAGVDYQFTKRFKAGVAIYYSPEASGEVGPNWKYEATAELKLPKRLIFEPAITGELAWQDGDEEHGGEDYGWWNAGLELGFAKHYKLDLRYHDTFHTEDCAGECGPRVNAALKAEF